MSLLPYTACLHDRRCFTARSLAIADSGFRATSPITAHQHTAPQTSKHSCCKGSMLQILSSRSWKRDRLTGRQHRSPPLAPEIYVWLDLFFLLIPPGNSPHSHFTSKTEYSPPRTIVTIKIPGQEDVIHLRLFFSVFSVTLGGRVRIPSSLEVLSTANCEGICLFILGCHGPLSGEFYFWCVIVECVAVYSVGKTWFSIGYQMKPRERIRTFIRWRLQPWRHGRRTNQQPEQNVINDVIKQAVRLVLIFPLNIFRKTVR